MNSEVPVQCFLCLLFAYVNAMQLPFRRHSPGNGHCFLNHKYNNVVLPVLLQSIKHKVEFQYCINRSVMFFPLLLSVQLKRVSLRWLKTVSSTFQDLEFDGSL